MNRFKDFRHAKQSIRRESSIRVHDVQRQRGSHRRTPVSPVSSQRLRRHSPPLISIVRSQRVGNARSEKLGRDVEFREIESKSADRRCTREMVSRRSEQGKRMRGRRSAVTRAAPSTRRGKRKPKRKRIYRYEMNSMCWIIDSCE